jgi:hypothetical protein
MVTLDENEINKGLDLIDDTIRHLKNKDECRVNSFVQGHLREYGFHLFFNRMGVYATDADFMVRNRNGNICCLLEVKEIRPWTPQELSEWHVKPYLEIASALGVPFYYVRYYEGFTGFRIDRYESDGTGIIRTTITKRTIDEDTLREFLNGIADGKSPAEMEVNITTEDLI